MKYGVVVKCHRWEWGGVSHIEPGMYIFVFNNAWKRISVLIFHSAIWQILKADDVFRKDSYLSYQRWAGKKPFTNLSLLIVLLFTYSCNYFRYCSKYMYFFSWMALWCFANELAVAMSKVLHKLLAPKYLRALSSVTTKEWELSSFLC